MPIQVIKLRETGYEEALHGISLNKEQSLTRMPKVAQSLSQSSLGSHRKFLRQIGVWYLLELPRFLWTEMDTYKVSTVRNSGSTMHNLHKRVPLEGDFHLTSLPVIQEFVKQWYRWKDGEISISEIKACLPEGYLQQSVWFANYEVIRTIYLDRICHRLPEWRGIANLMVSQLDHQELIVPTEGDTTSE